MIQKAFEFLSRVSEDRFEERARALAYGAVYVDANDCDWRSLLENRVIWWYGDSQMRTLVFEVAKQFNVSLPAVDFQSTKTLFCVFDKTSTQEDLAAGDVVVFILILVNGQCQVRVIGRLIAMLRNLRSYATI